MATDKIQVGVEIPAVAALNRIADALEAIAAAIHRHADVHLYVNDPDAGDAPAEAGSLPGDFKGMR